MFLKRFLLAPLLAALFAFAPSLAPAQGMGPGPGVSAGYLVDAADFDTNDYLTLDAAPTGLADGKTGTVSLWFRIDSGDGVAHSFFALGTTAGGLTFDIRKITANTLRIRGTNAATTEILHLRTVGTFLAGATWYNLQASWDLTDTGKRHLYITDASDLAVTTYTDDTIDYAPALPRVRIGADTAVTAAAKMNGCIGELWFNDSYIDLSQESNRRKFISAGLKPVPLGADGSLPTGSQPVFYHRVAKGAAVASFATELGSAGTDMTITGTLDTCSTSPSD